MDSAAIGDVADGEQDRSDEGRPVGQLLGFLDKSSGDMDALQVDMSRSIDTDDPLIPTSTTPVAFDCGLEHLGPSSSSPSTQPTRGKCNRVALFYISVLAFFSYLCVSCFLEPLAVQADAGLDGRSAVWGPSDLEQDCQEPVSVLVLEHVIVALRELVPAKTWERAEVNLLLQRAYESTRPFRAALRASMTAGTRARQARAAQETRERLDAQKKDLLELKVRVHALQDQLYDLQRQESRLESEIQEQENRASAARPAPYESEALTAALIGLMEGSVVEHYLDSC